MFTFPRRLMKGYFREDFPKTFRSHSTKGIWWSRTWTILIVWRFITFLKLGQLCWTGYVEMMEVTRPSKRLLRQQDDWLLVAGRYGWSHRIVGHKKLEVWMCFLNATRIREQIYNLIVYVHYVGRLTRKTLCHSRFLEWIEKKHH